MLILFCVQFYDKVKYDYRSTCKSNENDVKKSGKKTGRIRIGQVFRRSLSKDNSGCLFGQPLAKVCDGEMLPRSVMVRTLIYL